MNLPDAFRAYLQSTNGLRSEHEHYTLETWNAALDAAAKRLQDWSDFWDGQTLRDSMNDFGKAMFDAQRSNQKACIEAIKQLRIENEKSR